MSRCAPPTKNPPLVRKPTSANLGNGEAVMIARRRMDLTQGGLSKKLGISRRLLPKIESGAWDKDAEIWKTPAIKKMVESVKSLDTAERILLCRERAKLTLAQVAAATGMSAYWIGEVERGKATTEAVERLAAWWRLI